MKVTEELIEEYRELIGNHEGPDTALIKHAREVVAKADAKMKTFNVCVAASVEVNERVRAANPEKAAEIALERAGRKLTSAVKRTALENGTLLDAHITNDEGAKAAPSVAAEEAA